MKKAKKRIIRSIYFFGSDHRIAEMLGRIRPVHAIICEKKQFNRDLYDYARVHSATLTEVSQKSELDGLRPPKNTVGISCGTGLIFGQHHLDLFEHGIWNIHTGKLPDFRGRHPISWGFIRNVREFTVTIHRLDKWIDRGYLLAETSVPRELHDTEIEIEKKMWDALSRGLLHKAFQHYLSGKKCESLGKGHYYESLAHKFKSIDPRHHDGLFVFNLFKSQAKYGGIRVRNKMYKECVFVNGDHSELYQRYTVFKSKDGIKMGLK